MPELDALGLLDKYRAKGVLLDTNLLVLLLVGMVNKRRISNFKRTQNFSIQDFDLLLKLIGWFGKLIATPHVLSQVSDLTDLPGRELRHIRGSLDWLTLRLQQSVHEVFSSLRVTYDWSLLYHDVAPTR